MRQTLAQITREGDQLTNFFRQDLQVRHPLVLEQLDSIDAVEAVVFHHEERRVHAKPVQHGSLPLALVSLLTPVVLDANSQNAVGVQSQRVTQFPAASLSDQTG